MPTSTYTVALENGEYSNVDNPNSGVEVVTWKSSVHSVLKKVNSCAVIVCTKCYCVSPLVPLTSGRWHIARVQISASQV